MCALFVLRVKNNSIRIKINTKNSKCWICMRYKVLLLWWYMTSHQTTNIHTCILHLYSYLIVVSMHLSETFSSICLKFNLIFMHFNLWHESYTLFKFLFVSSIHRSVCARVFQTLQMPMHIVHIAYALSNTLYISRWAWSLIHCSNAAFNEFKWLHCERLLPICIGEWAKGICEL